MEFPKGGGHAGEAGGFARGEILFFTDVFHDVVEFELIEGGVGEEFPRAVAEGDGPGFADGAVVLPVERVGPGEGFAGEEGEEAGAVDGAVGGDGDAGEFAEGGEEIEVADGFGADGAGLRAAGPAEDAGDAVAGFGDVEFHAAQGAGRAVGTVRAFVAIQGFGAVVAGEDDEGVVTEVVGVEVFQEAADGVVHLGDIAVVLGAVGVVHVGVETGEFLGGGDGFVGFVEPEIQEEGFAGGGVEEADGFIDDEAGGIALERADGLAVADEVGGVGVARGGVVLRVEPVVEAVVAGRGFGAIDEAVEMPFAGVTGAVAGAFEERGDGDFVRAEADAGARGNPVADAGTVGVAAGHETGAGRRADGEGRVAVGELDAVGGEAVEVGGLNRRVGEAREVAVAEVVAEEDDDVGTRGRGGGAEGERGEQQDGGELKEAAGLHGGSSSQIASGGNGGGKAPRLKLKAQGKDQFSRTKAAAEPRLVSAFPGRSPSARPRNTRFGIAALALVLGPLGLPLSFEL